MNAEKIVPDLPIEELFQVWLATHRQPLLCEFTPTVAAPVKCVEIGRVRDQPVYAYGALGSRYSALWWECWSLDRRKALECALPYLPNEVKKAYDRLQQLRDFLTEHIPTCPLCFISYDRSDDALRELQSRGQMQLACACEGSRSNASETLEEIRKIRDSLLSSISPHSSRYDVVEVKIGATVVARISIDGSSERVTISFSAENFQAARGDAKIAYVWPRTKLAILARQEDDCKIKAARGELLKLNLQWNPRRQSWTASDPLREGVTCFVQGRYAISNGGWHYCRFAPKEDGTSVWMTRIEPIHPIPARHQPRSAYRPVRR